MDYINTDISEQFNSFLNHDGSLRDILVKNTETKDWILLYDFLIKSDYKISYKRNGKENALPTKIENVLTDNQNTHLISIQEENIIFNLHFFNDLSNIEIDIDPRDFVGMDQYKIIIKLMEDICCLLSKDIILTYENEHDDIFFKIEKY